MQNKIEYHIKRDSRLTFKVAAGQTLKIGQLAEIAGDLTVKPAGVDSAKVLGVVYGGTVGKDGLVAGFKGDDKDVVTVVHNGNFIYAPLTGVVAGDLVVAGANGGYAKVGATPAVNTIVGVVVAATTKVAGQALIYLKA